MRDYSCGCSVDEEHRCDEHEPMSCHGGPAIGTAKCPPCRRAAWLSIGSGAGTTTTRTRRYRAEDMSVEGARRGAI